MTKLKKSIAAASLLILGLCVSACTQEESAAKTSADQPASSSKTVEALPVSSPSDEGQSAQTAEGQDGKSYSSATPAPAQIAHSFDFAPDDHMVGSPNAAVNMIVYASVTCGHCSHWFINDWPVLKAKYIDTGKVRMAFREIPTPPQQIAVAGFAIANCAPENQYMDIIVHQMENQKATFDALEAGNGQKVFEALAAKAGLNSEAEMQACFQKPEHIERINRSSQRLNAAGISGVPGILINGEVFEPKDKSAAALSETIDKLLK